VVTQPRTLEVEVVQQCVIASGRCDGSITRSCLDNHADESIYLLFRSLLLLTVSPRFSYVDHGLPIIGGSCGCLLVVIIETVNILLYTHFTLRQQAGGGLML
jgi:hypothetical protein